MDGPTPEQYNPPIGWWGHLWRSALCVGISLFAWLGTGTLQWAHARDLFWLDLAVGVACFPLVFLRRRWPLGVALTLTFAGFVSGFAAGPGTLAGVSLATRRKVWQILLVGLLGVAGSQVYFAIEPSPRNASTWLEFAFALVFTVAMLAIGMYVGSRRELMWNLRARAAQNESEQLLRLAQARSQERERIAREMHDVLAHRITLVSMHAGALAYRTDLPPEQIRETAQIIQAKAHEALTDLREVLGVLRDAEVPHRPQPTLADLTALVAEASGTGMRIDLVETLTERVPDRIGRTVYRIVQEGLTNARKHAAGAAVAVRVSGAPGDGIDVLLRNLHGISPRIPTPGAGMGLAGLRERAELDGGRLQVRDDESTFELHGWLPWSA